jgi:hypothetical protein
VVRDAFARRGHVAFSCDLVGNTGRHYQCDVRHLLAHQWDLMIGHPECRYLSNSGVLRLYKDGKKTNGRDEERWAKMQEAAKFFKELMECGIPKIALENPVMHGYAKTLIGADYVQSFQPYEFGADASKRTCLWLKGLPPLWKRPSQRFPGRWVMCNGKLVERWSNQTDGGQNRLGPSPERSAIRARTYDGVANAMAAQWG